MKKLLFGIIAGLVLIVAVGSGIYWMNPESVPEKTEKKVTVIIDAEKKNVESGKQSRATSKKSKNSKQPSLDEILQTVKLTPAEDDKASYEASLKTEPKKIYTMSTLPQDKSGIYWVKDSDGNVSQIAVSVPGEDSALGL